VLLYYNILLDKSSINFRIFNHIDYLLCSMIVFVQVVYQRGLKLVLCYYKHRVIIPTLN